MNNTDNNNNYNNNTTTTTTTITTSTTTITTTTTPITTLLQLLASWLIYAKPLRHPFRAFIEYINVGAFCFKMLPSVKFAEDKVLTFLILREKC